MRKGLLRHNVQGCGEEGCLRKRRLKLVDRGVEGYSEWVLQVQGMSIKTIPNSLG